MATTTSSAFRAPRWVGIAAPLVVVALLLAAFLALDPIAELSDAPPVEQLAVERVVLEPGTIELRVRNDGPDPVTIAQVIVNDALWQHEAETPSLGRLASTTVRVDFPWEEGLPLNIKLLTSTGVTIEHEIEAAAATPEPGARALGILALLGVYIGVIPVGIGLLWFPALARASRRWIAFFLAFTVGLLAFLLVETVAEGIELAGVAPASLDGLGLFALGAAAAVMGLVALEGYLRGRGRRAGGGLVLAYLIAVGIGLHNLGEGLAVGAAVAAGEVALGTFLVVGFALHNTTEGLAIVAPLGSEAQRPRLWHFVALGAVAGLPTILGAWGGGLAFSGTWAAFAFGVAAGAIAQVVWSIARAMDRGHGLSSPAGAVGFVAGLVVMYATGLLTP